jgi:hypothetical protein
MRLFFNLKSAEYDHATRQWRAGQRHRKCDKRETQRGGQTNGRKDRETRRNRGGEKIRINVCPPPPPFLRGSIFGAWGTDVPLLEHVRLQEAGGGGGGRLLPCPCFPPEVASDATNIRARNGNSPGFLRSWKAHLSTPFREVVCSIAWAEGEWERMLQFASPRTPGFPPFGEGNPLGGGTARRKQKLLPTVRVSILREGQPLRCWRTMPDAPHTRGEGELIGCD